MGRTRGLMGPARRQRQRAEREAQDAGTVEDAAVVISFDVGGAAKDAASLKSKKGGKQASQEERDFVARDRKLAATQAARGAKARIGQALERPLLVRLVVGEDDTPVTAEGRPDFRAAELGPDSPRRRVPLREAVARRVGQTAELGRRAVEARGVEADVAPMDLPPPVRRMTWPALRMTRSARRTTRALGRPGRYGVYDEPRIKR